MARREEILDSRAVVPENVVYRAFDAETLLLNLGTGTYHGLDSTGARALELLRETGGDVRLSIERLADEFGMDLDQLADDLVSFFGELVDRGLLEVQPK
jgi:Coenzyme PQQ synthesis protein D (PqqD)